MCNIYIGVHGGGVTGEQFSPGMKIFYVFQEEHERIGIFKVSWDKVLDLLQPDVDPSGYGCKKGSAAAHYWPGGPGLFMDLEEDIEHGRSKFSSLEKAFEEGFIIMRD